METKMKNSGQSTLEYAVLIVCVVAALISMKIYLKRSVSGNLRQAGDQIGSQYEPRNTTGSTNTTLSRESYSEVYSFTDPQYQLTVRTKTTEDSVESTKTWGDEKIGKMQ